MYTMKADGVLFHNPAANDPSRMAIGTEAKFELNKAGSLTFTLPPDNVVYHALKKRKSVVQLYQDGEMLFQGRVFDTVSDLQNMQEVYCEGDLNLLMDSVQPAMEFDGTAEEYLRQAISNHNAVMEADKHFVVGDVTAVEEKHKVKVKTTDYTDTLGDLRSLLVDEFGGYLRVRYSGSTRYLDYIKEYTGSSGQSVKFGVNLVDIEKRMDAQKLFTILLPVGKVEKGKRTTIADVNGGSIYLEDASAIAAYGRIIQTETFDNVTDPQELLEKAQEYMNRVKENRSITIRAVDMKIVDPNVDNILLGDRVVLDSFPHDLNESEICAKVVLQLDAPDQSEYTFGIPPSTLTDQIASRIKQTSTSIDKLREWLTVTDTELILAKEHVSEYGDIINNVRLEMDALNAEIKLVATQKSIDELVERVTHAEIEIDGIDAQIKLLATEHTINELVNRVTQAEIELDGINATIDLKASKDEVTELGKSLSQAGIRIDGIEAELELTAKQSVVDEVMEQLTEAGIRIDGVESLIELKASKDEMATMERRLSQAEIDIDGAKGQIALKASVADFEDLDSRVSQAEVDIDGANAAIALKASKDEVVGLTKRVSQAEIDINGAEAAIALKASQSDVQGLTKRVSQAEIDIDGANQQIGLFAGEVDALGNRLDGAEVTIDGLNNKINLKADKVSVQALETEITGLLKVENLQAEIADLPVLRNGSIQSDNIDSTHIECQSLDVNAALSIGGKTAATQDWVEKQGYATSGTLSNYATRAWVIDRGYVTASDVSQTLDSYVMQGELDDYATQKWVTQQGYLKTVPSGYATQYWVNTQLSNLNSVYATRDWVTGTATKGLATQTWVTSQGYLKSIPSTYATQSWVIERDYATVTDVSQTLGSYVMKAELDDYATKTWVTSQGYLKSVPSTYATQYWVNNQGFAKTTDLSVYATRDWVTGTATKGLATEAWVRENFSKASTTYKPTKIERYGSVSGTSIPVRALNESGTVLLTGTVDAGDVYNSGKNGVTLSAAGWQSGSNVVNASNGKSVTVYLPTFSTSGGTSWSNNKTTVYFSTSSVNGYLASKTVDASSVYTSGVNSGKSAVTLSAAGWVGSNNVVSASNGKSVTVSLPTFSTSGGTSWSNHKTTVYFSTPSVSGALKSVTVDATSEYNSGVTSGKNAVTLSAAGWQGSSNVISASNGKSVTVSLPTFSTSGGTSWSNNKTTVYFSTPSVSGALASKTVDATSVYNSGYNAGAASVDTTAYYNDGWNDCRDACSLVTVYTISENSPGTLYMKVGDYYTSVGSSWVKVTRKYGCYTIPGAKS